MKPAHHRAHREICYSCSFLVTGPLHADHDQQIGVGFGHFLDGLPKTLQRDPVVYRVSPLIVGAQFEFDLFVMLCLNGPHPVFPQPFLLHNA